MNEHNVTESTSINILQESTELQSELIREMSAQSRLTDMMAKIVESTSKILDASACTVFTIDADGETATQQAGTGYQKQFNGKRDVKVVPPDEVLDKPGKDKLGLTGWILSTGKPFLAKTPEEIRRHPHHRGVYDPLQLPDQHLRLQSFLGVPLRGLRGQVVGVIKAERRVVENRTTPPFSVDDQIALETIGRVASKCVAYLAMAHEDKENEAITAWARDVIEDAAAAEGRLDIFLDIAAHVTASAMRSDSCAIFLVDESGKTLTQRAGTGHLALRSVIRAYELPDPELVSECNDIPICQPYDCPNKPLKKQGEDSIRVGLTAWIAATGKSFHASNFDEMRAHCHHLGGYDKWNIPREKGKICSAFLGVPLHIGGTVRGVLKAENIIEIGLEDQRDFLVAEQQRLDLLAQDISLSITRLENQIKTRFSVINDAQGTIREILRGGLDIPELVEKVVTETAKLFNAKACALFLKEGNRLIQPPWAAFGWAQKGPTVREYLLVDKADIKEKPTPEERVGLTVWIAVEQKKFTARSNLELRMHPQWKGDFDPFNFEEGERCETFMGFPLVIKDELAKKDSSNNDAASGDKDNDKLVGVLKVGTKMRDVGDEEEFAYFDEVDEIVLNLIAGSAAIAIQNARLLESRRLAERVLTLADNNAIMHALYEFLQGREEVIGTLYSTAATVERRGDPAKANIIQDFAGLLEVGFDAAIMKSMARQMSNPIDSLLNFLAEAIRAEETEQIRELYRRAESSDGLPMGALLRKDNFLRDCTRAFHDTLRKIGAQLDEYGADPAQRGFLKDCLKLLDKAETFGEMNLFEKSVLGRIFDQWRKIIRAELNRFFYIPNPFIVGKPVKSPEMFRGREDVFKFISDNLKGSAQDHAFVLFGQRRTGKTSILYQLLDGRLGDNFVPVLIDLESLALANSTSEFLELVAEQLAKAAQSVDIAINAPARGAFANSPTGPFDQFLNELEEGLGDRRALVMFDEYEEIERKITYNKLDPNILRYLRHLVQHRERMVFIFTGAHQLEEMTYDYWSVFFNIALHQRVSFLKPEYTKSLIHEPVSEWLDIEYLAVERIIELTNGHPYFVQLICCALVNHCNAHEQNTASVDDVNQVVQDKLMTGQANFAYIWKEAEDIFEKLTIAGLAHTLGTETKWASPDDILETLAVAGSQIQRPALVDALNKLVDREVLEVAKTGELRFRFQIEVLRLWVEMTQRIATLVERM